MISTFIGRESELSTLNERYDSPNLEFFPIYGRRRVGKSRLILKFIEDKPSLYFLGKQVSNQMQLQDFMRTVAIAFEIPVLAEIVPNNWRAALELVMEHRPKGKKLVLVLDEFQWIAETADGLASLLQELLDMDWKETGEVMLILCGSYLGFMEREVLGSKSPLFGRRTGQILLKPFSYLEAGEFHPQWGLEDKAKAYFICGGIPFYHDFFNAGEISVLTHLERLFFTESSALYAEAEFLLREELQEVRRYFAILTAIAGKSLTGKDIAKRTGIDERKLHYYQSKLIALGYLARKTPLLPNKNGGNISRYAIDDALLNFWFRFVMPNTGYISEMGASKAFEQLVHPQLNSYFGRCFESLVRKALPKLYVNEGVNVPFEIGEYWDASVQIDIVGIRKNDRIDLGECKWGSNPSAASLTKEIQQKSERYPASGSLTIQPRIFTRMPMVKNDLPKGILWHSLEDLYAV